MTDNSLDGITPGGEEEHKEAREQIEEATDELENVTKEKRDDVVEAVQTLQNEGFLERLEEEIEEGHLLDGIAIEPENPSQEVGGRFRIDLPDIPDVSVDAPDVDVDVPLQTLIPLVQQSNVLAQSNLQLLAQILQVINQLPSLERQRINTVDDQSTSTGPSNAAEIQLGQFRKDFEVFYDVNTAAGDLVIEVSLDSSTWRDFAQLSIPAGGDRDVAQGETTYTYARAYIENSASDSAVNLVEIVGKGG